MDLSRLNSAQKKAVTFEDGPLLIVAGAGTGKTTVITQRLGWLILEKKISSENILCLTFTDKAAAEMLERVDQLLPMGYLDLWVSTFHSFCERILRDNCLEIGLDPNFKILTQTGQWLFLRQHIDAFDLQYYRPAGNPNRFLHALVQHFSRLKDEDISPEDYLAYAKKLPSGKGKRRGEREVFEEERTKRLELARAYKAYEQLLRDNGFLDFGDLITLTLALLRKRATVRKRYQEQFRYVLVDEFQDTNISQYELVKLLAAPRDNLTVVGDDDQSIYKFRGASVSNILEFKKDYPASQEIVLTENYRSTQNLLDLAYEFIQHNNPNRLEYLLVHQAKAKAGSRGKLLANPVPKKLKAQGTRKGIIRHLHLRTSGEEVRTIVQDIVRLKASDPGLTWSDFAILARANAYLEPFLAVLANADLPYQFVASRGLFQKPEVLNLISYLRLLDNYHESPALYRVMTIEEFGFTPREIVKLTGFASRKGISLYESLERIHEIPGLAKPTLTATNRILKLITKHTELARRKSVGQVLFRFLEDTRYLERLLRSDRPADRERAQNVAKFFRKIEEFENASEDKFVRRFVEYLQLLLELGDDPSPQPPEEGPDAVRVMTVHQAKGLEFTYVFLVNVVEKRFPSIERRDPIELPDELVKEIVPAGSGHIEEERRLFYVAMTRAKRGLFFSSAEDYGGSTRKRPSPFFAELKDELIERQEATQRQQPLKLGIPESELPETPRSTELPPSRNFSFSQLASFEICPKQYRYRHLLNIPVLRGRATYSFGQSVHRTLRDFYERIKTGKTPTKEELLRLFEANWIEDWYVSRDEQEKRRRDGRKLLKHFYEVNAGTFKPPVHLEVGFSFKLNGFTISGRIDRVDQLDNTRVEIIDYKTGRYNEERRKDDLKRQLLLYALAFRRGGPELFRKLKPEKLSYYYLEEDRIVSFDLKEDDLAKVQEWARKTINAILESDFKATPSRLCSVCDYRDICEDRLIE